ncbi:MAG: DUF362 domain-containing protein [Planctomycetes bacterium]|nr:DUF362 domain-containing protein [Planctomycetota bacterium]
MADPKKISKAHEGSHGLDRREFMASIAGIGAVGICSSESACKPSENKKRTLGEKPPRPVVALLTRPSMMESGGSLSRDHASGSLEALLNPLGGSEGSQAILGDLFKPGERVGIKLNCLAGPGLSPRPELVFALVEQLEKTGIRPEDIILFERTERELRRAGFSPDGNFYPGVRIMGNDHRTAGYEDSPTCFESIGSCFSNILTKKIDALINFGVLKDHDLAGVSIGLKNLYGLIHNPNKYHDNGCSPYVAHIAAAPPVRAKLRLTLCDGLIGQYQGGPALNKACTWNAGILLASTDPVALDTIGTDLIEKKRQSLKLKTLVDSGRYPSYLREAHLLGSGECRLEKIRVIKIA